MPKTKSGSSNPAIRVRRSSNAPQPAPSSGRPDRHYWHDATLRAGIIRHDLGFGADLLDKSASKVAQVDMCNAGWGFFLGETFTGPSTASTSGRNKRQAPSGQRIASKLHAANSSPIIQHVRGLTRKWIKRAKPESEQCAVSVMVDTIHMNEMSQPDPSVNALQPSKGKVNDDLRRQTLATVLGLAKQCGWIEPARTDYKPYEPQLFIRQAPPIKQLMSLVWFAHLDPPVPEEHTGEGHVEKRVGAELLKLICWPMDRASWNIISNTQVKFPDGLSASTKGAFPDLCQQSNGKTAISLIVPFIAEAKEKRTDETSAVSQMALAIHPTLLMLIMLHYRMAKWCYDDPVTSAMSQKPLDEDSFVFSIFYCNECVSIFANYPSIVEVVDGVFEWQLHCRKVCQFPIDQDMPLCQKLDLYGALLAVEQHTRNLEQKFSNKEDVEYFHAIFANSATTLAPAK